jgi:hypothetical protein
MKRCIDPATKREILEVPHQEQAEWKSPSFLDIDDVPSWNALAAIPLPKNFVKNSGKR